MSLNRPLLAWALGIGRIVVGMVGALSPGRLGRAWFGEVAQQPGTQLATRGLAVRDLALGLGVVGALASGRGARRWIEAGMLADTGDAVATLLARRFLPTRTVVAVVAIAGGAAAAGASVRGSAQ